MTSGLNARGQAQINGLTDDGKLYGYVYSGGLPIGFVAVPNN